MTRSIFDPTGGDTERSGSTFTPPDAGQDSHMPDDIIDGVVASEDDDETTAEGPSAVPSDALIALPPSSDADESADRGLSKPGSETGLGATPRDLA